MPPSRSRSTRLRAGVLLALWAAFSLDAAAFNPVFSSHYDASEDRLLATSAYGEIRERDFFIFMVMRDDVAPDALYQYLTEPIHQRRQALREHLHTSLEDYLIMLGMRERPLAELYPRSVDPLGERVLTFPVYEYVWTDMEVRRRLELREQDVTKYYYDHPDLFTRVETVEAREIFRRIPEDPEVEDVARADALLRDLRSRAMAGEDFAALAREYSEAPSANEGGLLPPLSQGMVFTEFEDALDELEPGEVSEPFRGVGGMYIVRLVRKVPSYLPPLGEIRDEVRRTLERYALRYMQILILDDYADSWRNALRPKPAWRSHNDDEWLAKVGKFELTVGDFIRLFPPVYQKDCFTNEELLEGQSQRIFVGEIVRQDCARIGLMGDERIARGQAIAPNLLHSYRRISELIRAEDEPTTDDLRRFFHENHELFRTFPEMTFFRIIVQVKNPKKVPALERLELIKEAKARLRPMVRGFVELLKRFEVEYARHEEEMEAWRKRAKEAGIPSPEPEMTEEEEEELVMKRRMEALLLALEPFDNPAYNLNIEPVKGHFENGRPPGVDPREVEEVDRFDIVGPGKDDEQVVYWICLDKEPSELTDFYDAFEIVEELHEASLYEKARQTLLEEILPESGVTWLYDSLPYEPLPVTARRTPRQLVEPIPEEEGDGDN